MKCGEDIKKDSKSLNSLNHYQFILKLYAKETALFCVLACQMFYKTLLTGSPQNSCSFLKHPQFA